MLALNMRGYVFPGYFIHKTNIPPFLKARKKYFSKYDSPHIEIATWNEFRCTFRTFAFMKPIEQITNAIKASKPLLFQKYHLKEIGIFGSYVRNEQKNESDLDVLVDYDKTPGLFSFVRLENELSILLGIKVDLVMKSSLKPHIGKSILAEVHYL